ncbi:MAG: UvrD-helicase domain-containing protein [Actinobacteria bacterium]|nr:UvrD-helicase domain-containing protein [Actinomycetota bacterium]MBU1609121.1 UvrD-helicase domain-containing protein [Actinomycetota bacterium]MBU2314749.1 UvrD-helicase domain-containing protein [Actinomycetota bacterium]MBU2384406.1 UvrD-helicase domain-containing protein [Actinomycetota bacterium]
MSEAGRSAGVEAHRLVALADAHDERAAAAREAAARWLIAHRTERQVAGTLAPLSACGFTFLHDRGWPGARRGSRAQIDHVLVGPGGVFVVDTKGWKGVTVAGGRVFRGQADVTDDLAGLADVGVGTEAVLAELGLAPGEVRVVVVLAGSAMDAVALSSLGGLVVVGERRASAFINGFGRRLTERQQHAVLGAVMAHFPPLGEEAVPLDLSVPDPVIEEPALLTVDEVADTFLAGMLAAPIEEWMAFLHPDQAKLVRRSFSGPARIRGAAGTGKTVVGLHRAAYLARGTTGRVIVTTFVRTLPAVLGTLLHRLAPETVDRVEFTGVHAFAMRVLRERGHRLSMSFEDAGQAFNFAWGTVGRRGPLFAIDENSRYWRDEIGSVIKGRGLTTFEQYADLARAGRRRPLRLEQRRAVWELYLAYERTLRERELLDFEDVILRAEASLRETPMRGVDHVIIDEAQDLSCAMLRMLHAIVGDRPDGLTLIGDGQQTIYPGGYSLAEAGISVAGRGVVMSTNYRNTREIAGFAASIVEGDEFVDIEGGPGRADAALDVPRTGPSPVLSSFASVAEHDRALVARVRSLVADGVDAGDIGVLTATNRDAQALATALRAAGFGVVELNTYSGSTAPLVKVGTIKRAKGLEFKHVLLGRVAGELLAPAGDGLDDGARERREIERRELYVGMTRARDGLWVGSLL